MPWRRFLRWHRPVNPGRTSVPLYKKEVMPRLGVAYSWDQKTVIRAGYGIFFIPNWLLFNLQSE